MRLPFPERIPFKTLFFFAAGLCVVQLLEHTNPTFALCCFFFVLFSGIAFNVAGGLTRPSGAYVFFFAMLGVIVGVVWKAVVGEPAESNLLSPFLTISLYLGGMSMMLLAAYLSRKVTLKRPLLGNILPDHNMQAATVGCTIMGFLIVVIQRLVPGGNGSIASALNQVNHFFPLAILLGVIHTIRRTGGRRSVNGPVLIAGSFLFLSGVIGFTKEGMLGPFVAWGLAAASQGYRLTRNQIVIGILAVLFVFRYLVPYSQIGRDYPRGSFTQSVNTSISLLSNLGEVRQQYLRSSADYNENRLYGYYNNPQGFFDRLQMITIDDALNNYTENFGHFGLLPVINAFENVVPHFIWKDKPTFLIGNVYAHEIGVLAPGDESTGVSFSSVSTAYHMIGWKGIFILAPVMWFILFWVYDSLLGDARKSPWPLLMLLAFSHSAPEGDFTAIIYQFTIGAFGIAFAVVAAAFLMPILGSLFIGRGGAPLKTRPVIRSVPRRLLPAGSSGSQA